MIKAPPTPELSTDPDNTPPRSRLFLVVPKTAEAKVFEVGGLQDAVAAILNHRCRMSLLCGLMCSTYVDVNGPISSCQVVLEPQRIPSSRTASRIVVEGTTNMYQPARTPCTDWAPHKSHAQPAKYGATNLSLHTTGLERCGCNAADVDCSLQLCNLAAHRTTHMEAGASHGTSHGTSSKRWPW